MATALPDKATAQIAGAERLATIRGDISSEDAGLVNSIVHAGRALAYEIQAVTDEWGGTSPGTGLTDEGASHIREGRLNAADLQADLGPLARTMIDTSAMICEELVTMRDTLALTGDHGSLAGLADDDHTQYLLAAGTRALTGNWDAGSFKITAETLESDVTTGTAPLIVASTTMVANLNADTVDGVEEAAFVLIAGTRGLSGDWDAGSHKITAEQFESDIVTGTAPLIVASTTVVANLNVDQVDGAHVGTSGAAVALMNTANTWSANQTIIGATLLVDTMTEATSTVGITAEGVLLKDSQIHLGDDFKLFVGTDDDAWLRWNTSTGKFEIGQTIARLSFSDVVPKIKFIADTYMDQPVASGAIDVLTLDQADQDFSIMKYIATSHPTNEWTLADASDFPQLGSFAGCIKIAVEDTRAAGLPDRTYHLAFFEPPSPTVVLGTWPHATKTADYTLTNLDQTIYVDGTHTMTLPTAVVGIGGKRFRIKNIGTGTVTIATTGSETIDLGSTAEISRQFDALIFDSDNVNWWIF